MTADSKRGLSANAIKLIAVAAMLIDHIAWYWFPLSSAPGFIMHTAGRITAPVMCFFIAEGYYRTRSVPRYAMRLLIFAIISQIPYCFYLTGRFAFILPNGSGSYAGSLSVMFTLVLGLIALSALGTRRLPRAVRVLIAALCVIATYFCDWPFFGVMFVVAFGSRRDFKRQAVLFAFVSAIMLAFVLVSGDGLRSMFQAGVLLSLPPLWLYNGKRAENGINPVGKYAFYVFYPLHLLILALVR